MYYANQSIFTLGHRKSYYYILARRVSGLSHVRFHQQKSVQCPRFPLPEARSRDETLDSIHRCIRNAIWCYAIEIFHIRSYFGLQKLKTSEINLRYLTASVSKAMNPEVAG